MCKTVDFGAALDGARDGGPGPAVRSAIMLHPGLGQCLIDARFDVAFRLAANRGEFRDHEITRALKHPLLAKGKWLDLTEIMKMFEHVGDFKNIAGAHLVGKVLEPVL